MGAKAMSKHDIFLAKIGSKINAVARDGSIVPAPVFQTHSTTSPTTFSYTQHTYYPHHPDQASSSPKRVPLELLSPRQHVLALPDPSKNSSSSDQNHIQGTFAPDVTSSPYAVSLQRPRPRIGAKPGGAGGKKHHPLNTHQPRLRSSNIECPAIRAVVTKLGVLIDVPEKGSKDKGIVAGGVSTVRFGRASQMGVREGENGHGDALTEAFPKMFGQSALDGSRIKEQQERGGMEVGNGERTVHVGDESGLGLKIGEQIRTDSGVDLTPVENLQMRDVAGEEALAVPTILVSPPHAPPHHELGETTTGAEKKAEDASIQEPVEETPEQIAAKIMDRIQRCKSWDVPTLRELTGMFALLEDRKEEQKGTDGTAPASSSKVAESTKNTRGGGRIRNKREQNGTIYVNPEFGLRLQDFDCMPNYSDTAGLGYARAATTSQVPMFSGESAHHPSSSDDVFHRSTWPTAHHFAADMVAPSLLNHSTSVQHAIAKHRAQIQDVSAGGAGFGVNGNGGFGMGRTSMVQMVTRKAGKHHHHHHHHHHSLPSIAQPRNPNNNQPAQNTTDPTSDNLFFTTISSPSPWAIQGVSAETPFLTSTNGAQQESFFPLVEQSLYDYLPVTTNISLDTQQQGNRNKGGTGAMSNAVVVANPPVAVLASSTTSMGTVPHLPVLNNNGHHQHTVQVEAITAGVQAQLKNGEHTAQLPVRNETLAIPHLPSLSASGGNLVHSIRTEDSHKKVGSVYRNPNGFGQHQQMGEVPLPSGTYSQALTRTASRTSMSAISVPSLLLQRGNRGKSLMSMPVKLGGLGPDKESEEYLLKLAALNKRKQYAIQIKNLANTKSPFKKQASGLSTARTSTPTEPPRDDSTAGAEASTGSKAALESEDGSAAQDTRGSGRKLLVATGSGANDAKARREKMIAYAATIKKPTANPTTSSSPPSNHPASSSPNTTITSSTIPTRITFNTDQDHLRVLEEEHFRGREVVEQIKKELRMA